MLNSTVEKVIEKSIITDIPLKVLHSKKDVIGKFYQHRLFPNYTKG